MGIERRQRRTESRPACRRNGVRQRGGGGQRESSRDWDWWGEHKFGFYSKSSGTEKNSEAALHWNRRDFDSNKKIRNQKKSAADSKNMKKPLKDLQAAAAAALFTGRRVHVTATAVRPNMHAHVNSDLSVLKTETLNLTQCAHLNTHTTNQLHTILL